MERNRRRILILGLDPPKLKQHQQLKARLLKPLRCCKTKIFPVFKKNSSFLSEFSMTIPPLPLPCRHYLHTNRNALLRSEGPGELLMEPLDGMKALHWLLHHRRGRRGGVYTPAESSAFSHTRCIFFQRHLSVLQDTFQDTKRV